MATPKLAMIPTAYKPTKLYSVLPQSGVGDFTFARASAATRVNEDGLIETMGNNVPRLDYTDGGCPNFLLEPQRTNLVDYSEDFSSWTQADTSTVSIADSFDGSNNAYKVSITGGSGFQTIRKTGLSVSGTQTFTIYAKKDTLNFIRILFGGFGNFWVDLENGTQGATTGSFNDITITSAGNGFFKIVATFTPTSTTTHVYLYPSIANANVSQTSGSVILQYAQLEQGSYPTSYIPTNGSTVTRVGETCNGSGDASTFNDSEGVLMTEISALADDAINKQMSLNNTIGSNTLRLIYNANNIRAFVQVSSSTVVDITHPLSNAKDVIKVLLKYKVNDYALWVNGFEVGTDTNAATFPINTLNQFSYNDSSSSNFYGNTSQIQYFDSALTDSELETLTSWTSFIEMANAQNYTII